ncbi:MAG: hypothetical protein JRJ79_10065 [Deltaproteobacteria bacterium]|nr:hypothetical protein [Deltaproteobacteria bacterium]MBW1793328.1 hypothetical protein [Deltaproteobacteria bacterium]
MTLLHEPFGFGQFLPGIHTNYLNRIIDLQKDSGLAVLVRPFHHIGQLAGGVVDLPAIAMHAGI